MTKQDYALIMQIIDAASQRGLFTAAQLTTVGALYERVAEAAKAAE